ncbi:hypothetical protein ABT072_44870 [Streptomyces sp. NPDC002589]|uniref:hypothetical protein n=1 Tax=Streptomyces sp. NPDC002589 TaxID=3154420 RepID=UPI00332AADDE
MSTRRKLAAAALAGGILMGGVAAAAPASAITWVPCPTNGTEIFATGGNNCYAGTPEYGYANIYNVTGVLTDYNNFTYWIDGTPVYQAAHVYVGWNYVHITGVQIDN